MIDPEEDINISEFISGDTSEAEATENEGVKNTTETVVDSSYSNEDLKEMHRTIIEFLEFISSEYEKNEE